MAAALPSNAVGGVGGGGGRAGSRAASAATSTGTMRSPAAGDKRPRDQSRGCWRHGAARALIARQPPFEGGHYDVGVTGGRTILLVDDEESIQKLLTFPLEREGYRVIQARDGEEALRRFQEGPIDLVVLDVMLPKLDGLEVCRRLRTASAVPIIMLTARDDEVDKVLGLELGADDYITKPFSIREFRSRIRAVLRRATLLSEQRPSATSDRCRRAGDRSRRSARVQVDGGPCS